MAEGGRNRIGRKEGEETKRGKEEERVLIMENLARKVREVFKLEIIRK